MLVIMTVRLVLKLPFKKAAPAGPSDVPAPLYLSRVSCICSTSKTLRTFFEFYRNYQEFCTKSKRLCLKEK